MRRTIAAFAVVVSAAMAAGCTPQGHMKNVREAADGDRVTVGTVQKEIRVGMSGVEVIEQLGSPNIVQTDSEGREVWIYDKFATESVAQESRAGIGALILGLTPILGGGVSASGSSSASSDSQRTLTVIIKFDTESRVRDFSYHTSRF